MQHPSAFVMARIGLVRIGLVALLAADALLTGCDGVPGAPPAQPGPPGRPDPPTLSIADVRVDEGDSGTRNAVFRVTLRPAASRPVTVSWRTADGAPRTGADHPQPRAAARAGADYRGAGGTLTFAPGATSHTITVTVYGDTVNEIDETFTVTLGVPATLTDGAATATGTIVSEAGDGDDPTAAGSLFRDACAGAEAACPLLVVVPAGSFLMGSPAAEAGRDDDDEPLPHRVTIPAAFAVAVFEATFAQWDACVAAGGCGHRPDDRGWGRRGRPVIDVSWDDAQAYVAWLSRTTGRTYRLLTEAEWEYAARAGTTTPFHTGAAITADQATYGATRTQAAGSYPPNAFGLHDVHGNAAELVADCHDAGSANGNGCARRVVRGGSWIDAWPGLRSAYRGYCPPTLRTTHNGFRVARALAP